MTASPNVTLPTVILGTDVAIGAAEREIVFQRSFDAPRSLVWRAFTEPEHLMRWWGPEGFSSPDASVDLRPGGTWRVVMRGPDGVDFPTVATFIEVDAPARLVMTEVIDEMPGDWLEILNTRRGEAADGAFGMVWEVTLEELAGRTTMTIVTRFRSVADREAILSMGMAEGLAMSLVKLAAALAEDVTAGDSRARA